MGQKLPLPIKACSIKFYVGDIEALKSFYPDIGYNAVVREIIHRHVKQLRESENREALNAVVEFDIDLSPILGASEE